MFAAYIQTFIQQLIMHIKLYTIHTTVTKELLLRVTVINTIRAITDSILF